MAISRSSGYCASAKDVAALICAFTLVAVGIININLLASANTAEEPEQEQQQAVEFNILDVNTATGERYSDLVADTSSPKSVPVNTTSDENDFSLKTLIAITNDRTTLDTVGASEIKNIAGRVYTLSFNDEATTETAYGTLSANPAVSISIDTAAVAKDAYEWQWGLRNTGMDFSSIWFDDIATTDREVIVTVIDSGVNKNHIIFKDANGNSRLIYDQYTHDYIDDDDDPEDPVCSTCSGHGTMTASVIAYSTPDNVKIRPIRVGNFSQMYQAIADVKGHTDIINLSLGEETPSDNPDSVAHYTQMDTEIVKPTRDAGAFIAGASGNEYKQIVCFPARGASVSAVSAIDDERHIADFSNVGPEIEYAMPGVDVMVASNSENNMVKPASGTSFSSPFLAAAAATIKLENPSYTPNQIQTALNSYATALTNDSGLNQYGHGVIDFGANRFAQPNILATLKATDWIDGNDTLSVGGLTNGKIKSIQIGSAKQDIAADDDIYWFNWTGDEAETITQNGDISITVEAYNGLSTTETVHEGFIDKANPTIATPLSVSDINNTSVKLNAKIQDADSGIAKIIISGNGINETATYTPASSKTVNFNYNLKNLSPATDYSVTIDAYDKVNHHVKSSAVSFRTTNNSEPTPDPDEGEQGGDSGEQGGDSSDQSDTSGTTPEEIKTDTNIPKAPKTEDSFYSYASTLVASGAVAYLIYYIATRRR